MSLPVQKIEVGFEVSPSGAILFTLDDAVKGILDNTDYKLGGTSIQFLDVTSRVRRFSISRGRSNLFSAFPAGQLNVEFNNHDRAFDPLYSGSPFAGNIVPRREIRITTDNYVQFTGWIDDWSFSYLPNGDSIAEAVAYDATSIISGQTLSASTPSAEKTGARITSILNSINWSAVDRDVDTGQADLGTQSIAADTNAMNYLQTVAASEPGLIFINKTGAITFLDRTTTPTSTNTLIFGETGIPFQNLQVSYGSENLYNEISVSRINGGTAIVTDAQSIIDYGARSLVPAPVLLANDSALVDLGIALAQQFSQPEYRFRSLEVALHKLDAAEQAQVLDLDLGAIAEVHFTPNNLGSPIEQYVQVISIAHTVNPESHYVDFGFQSVANAYLVLDDLEFGKLDTYSLSW